MNAYHHRIVVALFTTVSILIAACDAPDDEQQPEKESNAPYCPHTGLLPTFWIAVRDATGNPLKSSVVQIFRIYEKRDPSQMTAGCPCVGGVGLEACMIAEVGGRYPWPTEGDLMIKAKHVSPDGGIETVTSNVHYEMPTVPCEQFAYLEIRLDEQGIASVVTAEPRECRIPSK